MAGIFINYRRQDTQTYANMLYDALADHYGDERVFKDVDTIEVGRPWDKAIEAAVGRSDVMLVLIGERWLAQDGDGRRRLDEPKDYVRKEIEAGLQRDMRVIPVTVGGARMPQPEELPSSVAGLTDIQAYDLDDDRWRADRDELLRRLDTVMGKTSGATRAGPRDHERVGPEVPAPPPPAPPPQEKAKGGPVVTWGWVLTGLSLLLPFCAIVAVILGGLAVSRGRKSAGIAIIVAAVFVGLFSASFWLEVNRAA
jgi:hypothetical protein